MKNYKIIYDDNKVTIVTSIDAAHARLKLSTLIKNIKIHSCKAIKNEKKDNQ